MKNVLWMISLSFLVLSCRKDKEEAGSQPDLPLPLSSFEYSQFKPGNYWVYQQFKILDGIETPTSDFDSVYVERDSLINGQTYMKVYNWERGWDYKLFKDSAGYIVDEEGSVLFSSQVSSTNLIGSRYIIINNQKEADTICLETRQMTENGITTTTPAGNFTTVAFKQSFFFYPKWIHNTDSIRYMHTRYAKGIGIVTQIIPYAVGDREYYERRLVRYKVD
jgi:hypothetical protein